MKKVIMFFLILIASNLLAQDIEKVGFLTTKWCADKGKFIDCRMETVFCKEENCFKKNKIFSTNLGGQFVLYIHDEGKSYTLNFKDDFRLGEMLEKAVNKNEVTIKGVLHGDTIDVVSFEAPPPPKKSFFKGCL